MLGRQLPICPITSGEKPLPTKTPITADMAGRNRAVEASGRPRSAASMEIVSAPSIQGSGRLK